MRLIQMTLKLAAVMALLGLASCSVKENRVPCPCYLNVSFSDREHIRSEVTLLGWNVSELFRADIDVEEYNPYWVKPVRKGVFYLTALKGLENGSDASHYAMIKEGHQADSLYAFHTEVHAVDNEVFADVVFHKQFATVFFDIRKTTEQMKDFRFRIRGNVAGFDLLNYAPVPGVFDCSAVAGEDGRVTSFRIPRQMDTSITIEIFYKGESLGVFPLGKYIERLDYNWNAEDLQDIYVTFDLVFGQIIISVEGWEDGVVITYVEQ